MKLVLKSGEIKEVDTKFMFANQYNTTDGVRVCDRDVVYIIDDIRLGEFYTSSVKQGTYDEVAQAIADKRAQIDKCEGCWWFHEHTRIEEECYRDRETTKDGDKETNIITEKIVYKISCAHKPKYGDKCVHDIDDKPILFREKHDCFFCKYPQGLPDMKPFKEFMVANAEKYNIAPRWCNKTLSAEAFKHDKKFGSYEFEALDDSFVLENARNRFIFRIDLTNKKFILVDSLGYKVRKYLGEDVYNHTLNKSSYMPIKNYDKFAAWLWQIVDDFNTTK